MARAKTAQKECECGAQLDTGEPYNPCDLCALPSPVTTQASAFTGQQSHSTADESEKAVQVQ